MNNNATENVVKNDIPPHVWEIIHQFLIGIDDKSLDLREPHVRRSLQNIFPFVIFMYSILIFVGLFLNLSTIIYVVWNKLYKDVTHSFILNNALSELLKCGVVVPLTVYVLVVQNWTLGELLCSFLPMIQDIPLHTTTITFTLLALDRLRYMKNPTRPRLHVVVCTIGSWLTAVCLVLPYPIYIIYIDLGKYSEMEIFKGVGICVANLMDDMKEYIRGIFLITFVAPLALISYLSVKVSREIELQNHPGVIVFHSRCSRRTTDSHSTDVTNHRSENESEISGTNHESNRIIYEAREPEINIEKEKRTQKYLAYMITANAVCLFPLMVIRLARLTVAETYENSADFDYIYIIFVWIAFVPTWSTPLFYFSWQLNRSRKDCFKGFCCFEQNERRNSLENGSNHRATLPHISNYNCHRYLEDPTGESTSSNRTIY